MKISVYIEKLSVECEQDFNGFELSDEVRTAAKMWAAGASPKEIGKALKLNSGGKYSNESDAGQNYICDLRRVFPKMFPYRTTQRKRKS